MEYDIIKENYTFCEKILQASEEQNFDTEISLPDYCSDVKRILKCMVTPNIFSCNITGDRVTADGEAEISVVYVGENGKVECYRQNIPFSKYVEIRQTTENCIPSVKAKTEYVNCRAASQRKISVSGNIGLIFTVTRMKTFLLPSSAKGGGIQLKKEKTEFDMEVNRSKKIFEMGETVSIGENFPFIGSVIKGEACATVDTVKAVENKVLIKGEMQIYIIYCTDGENREIVSFNHVMPISQILQIDDVDENCNIDANVSVSGITVSSDTDSSGNNSLIQISVKAEADVKAYRKTTFNTVEDCYSTTNEIKTEYKNLDFTNHIFTYKETKQIKDTLDFATLNIKRICCGFCQKAEGSVTENGGKLEGKGRVLTGFIYENTEGEYGYIERSSDFTFECQGKQNSENLRAIPIFSTGGINCNIIGNDKGEMRMNIGIFMPIYEIIKKRVCTFIELEEEKSKRENEGSLVVYFSDEGEELWNIAQRYNTTTEKIKEENELTQDIISERKMIMVPS